MMSLQTSTHSSQMNTVGPAISLRTSFWSLLQKEQRRISESPVFFMRLRSARCCSSLSPADHVVHDTIVLRLDRLQDEVAIRVGHDLLQGLFGVEGQDLVQSFLDPQDL